MQKNATSLRSFAKLPLEVYSMFKMIVALGRICLLETCVECSHKYKLTIGYIFFKSCHFYVRNVYKDML